MSHWMIQMVNVTKLFVTPVKPFLFVPCEHSWWFLQLHADPPELFCSNHNPHSFRMPPVTIYLEFKSTELQGCLIDAAHKYPIPLISTWEMRWLSEQEWEAIDQRQITAALKVQAFCAGMGVCCMGNSKWKLRGIKSRNEMDKRA